MTCRSKVMCGGCGKPLAHRAASCGNAKCRHLSAEAASAILAEYPDADLSAFDVDGDVETLAIEATAKSLDAIGRKIRKAGAP